MIKKLIILGSLLISTNAHGMTVQTEKGEILLESERIAHVTGEVGPQLYKKFFAEMVMTMGKPGDRLILIDSPGGLVDDGDKMIALIDAEKKNGTRVVCVVTKSAASMAFNLLTHCDVRYAVPRAMLLFHPIAANLPCGADRYTGKFLMQMAQHLIDGDQVFRLANSKALNMSLSDYDMFGENNTYWRAPTLLARGYLHALVLLTP